MATAAPVGTPFARDRAAAIGWGVLTLATLAEEAAEEAGLSVAQLRVLAAFAWRSAHPGEIADLLDVTPPSVSRMSDRLEAAGLIERTPDPADRRRVHHGLTPRGQEMLTTTSRRIAEHVRAALGVLDDRQLATAEAGLLEASRAAVLAWLPETGLPGWPTAGHPAPATPSRGRQHR